MIHSFISCLLPPKQLKILIIFTAFNEGLMIHEQERGWNLVPKARLWNLSEIVEEWRLKRNFSWLMELLRAVSCYRNKLINYVRRQFYEKMS